MQADGAAAPSRPAGMSAARPKERMANMQHKSNPASRAGFRESPWLLLTLLFLAYTLALIDRNIVSLLVDPIKASLGVSDTQMGLLQGLAFILLYSVLGFPLGMVVDRWNRIRLVAAGLLVWSLATAACGLATSYWLLFAARVAVGFGEAALSPAAYSLLGDRFPRERIGMAMGIFFTGGAVGAALALIGGGMLVHALQQGQYSLFGVQEPWQLTFIIVGLPGIALAVLFLIAREPRRTRAADGTEPTERYAALLRSRWNVLLSHHLAVGFGLMGLAGAAAWIIPLFTRVHHLGLDVAGPYAGTPHLVGAVLGPLLLGVLGDRVARKGPGRRMLLMAVCLLCGAVAGLFTATADTPLVAAVFFCLLIFFAVGTNALGAAALHDLVPGPLRGRATAVFLFVINVVGHGLGPAAVAYTGEHIFGGSSGLASALGIIVPVVMLIGAGFGILTARLMKQEGEGAWAD